MENEIISGRFTTGEYFIATLMQAPVNKIYVLADPILFEIVASDTDKQYSIAMRSLVPLGRPGQKVTIAADQIMFCIDDLDESIISQYQTAISQIEVAKKLPSDLKIVK